MVVYYDEGRTYPTARLYPYGPASPGESGHIDFKQSPELIRSACEYFRSSAQWPAVQTFYSLLEWVNDPASHLHTNDSSLRAPASHQNEISSLALCIYGRVYLLYRDLRLNASTDHT